MEKTSNRKVTKVYCEKCDLVFESRDRFEKHLRSHSSNLTCEICPIDTAIAKFTSLFKRKSPSNLE